MAQKKVSQLAVATTLNAADILPVVQGGITKQLGAAAAAAFLSGAYGSNANGEFVRLECGVQLCWHRVSLAFLNGDALRASWNYPAPFKSGTTPINSGTVQSWSVTPNLTAMTLLPMEPFAGGVQITQFRLIGQANFVSGNNVVVQALAVGIWK